jgi:hypothetical protein
MLGSFNPTIFQPRWLGTQQLIRTEEAENAKITIIRAELADFSTDWFQMQVPQNRFVIRSTDPIEYPPLRDLATAIFSILPHTPVTTVGLNRELHFKMPSSEAWHGIGHLFAPKEQWNAIMEAPGLRSMLMQGRRKGASSGILKVKIEPSVLIEHGLYVEINEEFKAAGDSESEGARWVPSLLTEHWDAIMKYSEEAAEHLLALVKS